MRAARSSVAATPQLVVAPAGTPVATTARAEATSQAFGSRTGTPGRWSERRRSHRLWRSAVWEPVMSTPYAAAPGALDVAEGWPVKLRGLAGVDPLAEDGHPLRGPCSVAWHRPRLELGKDGV